MKKQIKGHKFIRLSFLLGYAWSSFGLFVCFTEGGHMNEIEIAAFFLPGLALMIPTCYLFFIQSKTPEVIPGFIGLYFKRRRIQEEAKIEDILNARKGNTPSQTTPKKHPQTLTKEDIIVRIANALANPDSVDPIVAKINLISKSTFQHEPITDIDSDIRYGTSPAAIMKKGTRVYPKIMNDGRGKINLMSPEGLETTYKFHFPEELTS